MGIEQTNKPLLDRYDGLEIVLELLSFSGGENTISEDQATKANEARILENWDATSLGGMERTRGFNEVADGSSSYTNAADFIKQHEDSGGTQVYAIYEGDLIYKSGSAFTNDDNNAFTSGILSHGFSDELGFLWITNSTDNLKKKAVGVSIATPSSVPPDACDRVYRHKNRMVAEGSLNYPYRVYGSRAGTGNWTAADAWSLSNDAYSIDLPDHTQGCMPDFPSGNEILVFTKRNAYALSNFPNTAFRPISTPGRGCSAPYSIALGDEGVYFLSQYPTLGIFVYDGVNFNEITQFNSDVFVELIDFTKRIYGIYRDRKYYLIYNELGSGASYPNCMRIFDAKFSRWMNRPVNPDLSDNFGYPALLKYSANELYITSSQKDKIYEFETEDDSDENNDTQATYKTKDFSSRDFAFAGGGQFAVDDVKIQLTKITVTYYGTVGNITIQWTADRGLNSGSKTLTLTASGDLLNSTFIVNSSLLASLPPDKSVTTSFPSSAVGRRFNFQITNEGSGIRPKIKKIKIHALAVDEA
ncbi:hypothetical protein KW791_00530 [Candidatus Parcubacteria bacterium]|nr:hypothetical protein [Candidatus Parcubacteria bacterium]